MKVHKNVLFVLKWKFRVQQLELVRKAGETPLDREGAQSGAWQLLQKDQNSQCQGSTAMPPPLLPAWILTLQKQLGRTLSCPGQRFPLQKGKKQK